MNHWRLCTLFIFLFAIGCSADSSQQSPPQVATPLQQQTTAQADAGQNKSSTPTPEEQVQFEAIFWVAGTQSVIYDSPPPKNKKIKTIKAGERVKELEKSGDWVKSIYDAGKGVFVVGWINTQDFAPQVPYQKVWEMKAIETQIQRFSPQMQQLIKEHRIKIGMTDEMIQLSWGTPEKRLVLQNEGFQDEAWVYNKIRLILHKGRLTEWVIY
jgi:hypothetical protein